MNALAPALLYPPNPNEAEDRVGLHTPHAILRRAHTVAALYGAEIGGWRSDHPAARAAQEAGHMLYWARDQYLGFLHLTRGKNAAVLVWHYRAYADRKRRARLAIRYAGECLVRAEGLMAEERFWDRENSV